MFTIVFCIQFELKLGCGTLDVLAFLTIWRMVDCSFHSGTIGVPHIRCTWASTHQWNPSHKVHTAFNPLCVFFDNGVSIVLQ